MNCFYKTNKKWKECLFYEANGVLLHPIQNVHFSFLVCLIQNVHFPYLETDSSLLSLYLSIQSHLTLYFIILNSLPKISYHSRMWTS